MEAIAHGEAHVVCDLEHPLDRASRPDFVDQVGQICSAGFLEKLSTV